MQVVRIIVYEGTPAWVEKQMSLSLPDGVRNLTIGDKRMSVDGTGGGKIIVQTIRPADTAACRDQVDLLRGYINKTTDWATKETD